MMTTQGGLARCKFCGRTFGNNQAVRAHLKGCVAYRQRLPRQIERKAIPAATTATRAAHSPVRPERTLNEDQSKLVSAVIDEAIEQDCGLRYGIPLNLKNQAITEIRQELSSVPLYDFTFEELLETAEAIRDQVYDCGCPTRDALTRQKIKEENMARRRRKEMWRRLERMGQEAEKERQKAARLARAVQYAERQLADAPGMDIWNRWSAMQEVRNSLGRLVTGAESSADMEKVVDDLLLPFLQEGAHRAAEERKVKLIELGKRYVKEELDDEEDVNSFERSVIVDKVTRALGTKLRGDETRSQVENLVEYILDEELL